MNAIEYVMNRFKTEDLLSSPYITAQPSLLKGRSPVDYNMPLLYYMEETYWKQR